jgi:arginyl-tRNA synthetase
MSKRRGDIVTVDDLIDAIGVDAVRFFMVARSHDSTLDLDLDLAVEQSSKNPVYYVQYAHARICSVLANLAREEGGETAPTHLGASFGEVAVGPYERNLARTLARFPLVVLEAVERRGPHRVHAYLGELAAEFHVFYRNCRVLTDDPEVAAFRTGLCVATRTTLAKGLELLGVSAPRSM